jgi:predicted DNA-binding protein YlxM (UPF0122 family)
MSGGKKLLSEEQIDKLCELYRTRKYSMRTLGERFGVGLQTISKYLKQRGVPMNPPYARLVGE